MAAGLQIQDGKVANGGIVLNDENSGHGCITPWMRQVFLLTG